MSPSVRAALESKGKRKMNISKLKLAWKFITGGREGVLDYCLDVANTIADRIPDAKKEEIGKYLATARKVLDTMSALSWLCPSKWIAAYEKTVAAFRALVAALDDLKVTPGELTAVCNSFRIAYAAWRAE